MTKVTSYQQVTKTPAVIKIKTTGARNKQYSNITLVKFLKKIVNSTAALSVIPLWRASCKDDMNNIQSLHGNTRKNVIDSRVLLNFVNEKLMELDLIGNAKKDPVYASQMYDAVMSSVYRKKKDVVVGLLTAGDYDTSEYLRMAGIMAILVGIKGKNNDDGIFIPTGAGANPFVTAVASSAQKKFFLNKDQLAYIKRYTEEGISSLIGHMCEEKGWMPPEQYGITLDNMARLYLLTEPPFLTTRL